jgi:hypothetical protein
LGHCGEEIAPKFKKLPIRHAFLSELEVEVFALAEPALLFLTEARLGPDAFLLSAAFLVVDDAVLAGRVLEDDGAVRVPADFASVLLRGEADRLLAASFRASVRASSRSM